jgi:protein-S-isoprenylcysteine O-methyltransferase Ste14
MEGLFKAAYFLGVALQVMVRIPHNRRRRRIRVADERLTLAERVLPAMLSLVAGGLPLLSSLTGRLNFANYRMSRTASAVSGTAGSMLLAASLWLFWRSHRDLGTNWFPDLEIGEEHTLTTRGVYGAIRHPMYASNLLWGLGQALMLQNWIAGFPGPVTFLFMYLFRVPQEERMMLDHFGDAYREYCARTGRIVPRLRR